MAPCPEGESGSEGYYFFVAEGAVEGRIAGRLQAANHPRSRVNKNALPNIQGAIETEDGATVIFDWRGFARPYPPGSRQIVVAASHVSGDQRYAWLNDVVCVRHRRVPAARWLRRAAGSRRRRDRLRDRLAELIWEQIP